MTDNMIKYECTKCGRTFKFNCEYIRHTSRKSTCDDSKKDEEYAAKRTCTYCNKTFTRINTLTHHMDKCKNKMSDELEIENENEAVNININANKEIDKQKEQAEILAILMKEMTEMKQQMKQEQEERKLEREQMQNTITELKTKLTKKATVKGNLVNGNLVNGDMNTNNQNTVNNIHNDIKIIAYGKEDLSFITDDNYRLLLNKGFKSVQNLVEYIHLNQNKPENQNIYVSNMRDNYVLIFDGNQWQLKERDDVLQEMIENKTDILSEKFDELIKTLDESTIKKFKRFLG